MRTEANNPETTPHPPGSIGGGSLENTPSDTLLSEEEAASILRVQKSTLSVWRCTGRYNLIHIKVGRRVFYRAGDLRAWLANRARSHTGAA